MTSDLPVARTGYNQSVDASKASQLMLRIVLECMGTPTVISPCDLSRKSRPANYGKASVLHIQKLPELMLYDFAVPG